MAKVPAESRESVHTTCRVWDTWDGWGGSVTGMQRAMPQHGARGREQRSEGEGPELQLTRVGLRAQRCSTFALTLRI